MNFKSKACYKPNHSYRLLQMEWEKKNVFFIFFRNLCLNDCTCILMHTPIPIQCLNTISNWNHDIVHSAQTKLNLQKLKKKGENKNNNNLKRNCVLFLKYTQSHSVDEIANNSFSFVSRMLAHNSKKLVCLCNECEVMRMKMEFRLKRLMLNLDRFMHAFMHSCSL